jgi:hypothetical protein
MTRIRTAIAALALLAGAASLTSCDVIVYPSGCVLRIPADQPVPGDWIYDGPTSSWWDPEDGFIGFSFNEGSDIWWDTYLCMTSEGARRY